MVSSLSNHHTLPLCFFFFLFPGSRPLVDTFPSGAVFRGKGWGLCSFPAILTLKQAAAGISWVFPFPKFQCSLFHSSLTCFKRDSMWQSRGMGGRKVKIALRWWNFSGLPYQLFVKGIIWYLWPSPMSMPVSHPRSGGGILCKRPFIDYVSPTDWRETKIFLTGRVLK